MRFKLNLPNDYGSEGDYAEAVAAAYGDEAPDAIDEVELREPIFVAAEESGLSFIRTTDYGAEWAGTAEQFEACIGKLPAWARPYASIIEE
ncbi:MAG: hypothetical protein IPN63_07660 [Gammaproteobacteria bacterium]|nr:hypothetical protein [Gammaproteobacteria bacterium]